MNSKSKNHGFLKELIFLWVELKPGTGIKVDLLVE